MNFVSNVFKKYLNKNEHGNQNDQNVLNQLLIDKASDNSESKTVEDNKDVIEENDCYQDAETDQGKEAFSVSYPEGEMCNQTNTDKIEQQTTLPEIVQEHETNKQKKRISSSSNHNDADSLDNSMIDSLELDVNLAENLNNVATPNNLYGLRNNENDTFVSLSQINIQKNGFNSEKVENQQDLLNTNETLELIPSVIESDQNNYEQNNQNKCLDECNVKNDIAIDEKLISEPTTLELEVLIGDTNEHPKFSIEENLILKENSIDVTVNEEVNNQIGNINSRLENNPLYNRQDTREFENLEQEFEKNTNRGDAVLEELLTCQKINEEAETTDFIKTTNTENKTIEEKNICENLLEDDPLFLASLEDSIEKHIDQQKESLDQVNDLRDLNIESHVSRVLQRQDTKEFEIIEKQLAKDETKYEEFPIGDNSESYSPNISLQKTEQLTVEKNDSLEKINTIKIEEHIDNNTPNVVQETSSNLKTNVSKIWEKIKDDKIDEKTWHKNCTTKSYKDDENAIRKYRHLLKLYEAQIATQGEDLEKLKIEFEKNMRHFTNTEMAFSDVFEKYEKAKLVITAYRKNEDVLLENLQSAEHQLNELECKCLKMKQQLTEQIKRAERQVEQEKEIYKRDITKLQAVVKRLEIKASSLEVALHQKTEECQALAALCDDITGRTN
ncbi:hypothetical protein ABEB36_008920 [Hypothenemus hampei]|uniref:Transforming acidic coiled-coil-containing protein C-terminal domain-containing protein n=1 Tax=Hypothenemus hampei TaxID=57062 RepID=A0ABD1ENH8_HYPHA